MQTYVRLNQEYLKVFKNRLSTKYLSLQMKKERKLVSFIFDYFYLVERKIYKITEQTNLDDPVIYQELKQKIKVVLIFLEYRKENPYEFSKNLKIRENSSSEQHIQYFENLGNSILLITVCQLYFIQV